MTTFEITPDNLVEQLDAYATTPTSAQALVQLVRPARLTLRDNPSSRKDYGREAGFWEALGRVWKLQANLLAQDDNEDDSARKGKNAIPAIQALAALLTSLTTMYSYNQNEAISHVEPHLKSILITASSLFNLEDSTYQPMTRTCCQALANLVTANPSAASRYFPQRLKAEESDQLFQRLLATPDEATLQALLIFLLNSIHSRPERALLLGTSKAGTAILDRIMVLVSSIYDNDSKDNPVPLNEEGSDLFGLSFAIVRQIIEAEAFPQTYTAHKLLPGFVISPTLIIFLKFLDGYLSSHLASPTPTSLRVSVSLIPFLHDQLTLLAGNLLEKQERERSDALGFQGVVLILHCLCEIGLGIDREVQRRVEEADPGERETDEEARVGESIELVTRLLHFSSTSIPAPSARPPPNSSAKISEIDPSNPASIPPPPHSSEESVQDDRDDDVTANSAGFQQLKLICVKYLGIVSFQTPVPTSIRTKSDVQRSKLVEEYQDSIRESGGLGLLLGMCQIDGRNPTLREHALFAIRNVLKNNLKNQEYIEKMKPEYKVGEDGSLEDLPPALRPQQ